MLRSKGTESLTTEERIRVAMTEPDTTFIKLGQVLSTRPELVGRKLADELAKLRSDTPADDPSVAVALIESELGGKINTLFANFEHRRLEPVVNRLVMGILTAALFMGSAPRWTRCQSLG